MSDYIKKKLKESKIFLFFKRIPVTIINAPINNIDIKSILSKIETILGNPKFIKNIEEVFIGDFKFLKDRQIQAMFNDNCIYLSSLYSNPDLICKDVIHEIGHSLENDFGLDVYGDGALELEYFGKKKKLLRVLSEIGYSGTEQFLNDNEYSVDFDNFLLNTVGYENLGPIIVGLFTSPYSATSLSEYFANGFEQFHIGERDYLRKICPILFSKVQNMDKLVRKSR